MNPFTDWENWQSWSLAKQVAQLIVVRASGHLFDQQIEYPQWEPPQRILQRWVQDLGVSGVLLLGGSAVEIACRTHQLQDWATVPLLICADIEEGVGQRFAGATWFPPPMALGTIAQTNFAQAQAYAEQMGATIAQESLALGINWLLAPVVDVNNNPANPVINVRAFSDAPQQVSQLATAFLKGVQRYPVLSTVKHFPGHGDTAIDSHLELPVLPHSKTRLLETELPPFQAAIQAGVDAVMTAHVKIPALDTHHPATLSKPIVHQLLRQEMGFDGLVVTDALVMGAMTQQYGANEAPVLAIEAGADIVLMPIDPEGAIEAICRAVETGRISPDRIQTSLARIWRAKQKVNSAPIAGTPHAWEQVLPPTIDLQTLTTQLAQPEAEQTVTAILQTSMRSSHPRSAHFPLSLTANQRNLSNLIIVDDLLNSPFLEKQSPAIVLPRKLGYTVQRVDRFMPISDSGSVPVESIACVSNDCNASSTLLQVFVRGNPFRGSGLNPIADQWLHYLIETSQLQALVVYGSPYALEAWLPKLPADIPYVFTYGQMASAQTLALTTLFHTAVDSLASSTFDRQFTD